MSPVAQSNGVLDTSSQPPPHHMDSPPHHMDSSATNGTISEPAHINGIMNGQQNGTTNGGGGDGRGGESSGGAGGGSPAANSNSPQQQQQQQQQHQQSPSGRRNSSQKGGSSFSLVMDIDIGENRSRGQDRFLTSSAAAYSRPDSRRQGEPDAYWFAHGGNPTNSTSTKPQHTPSSLGGGPNDLFFGQESSGLSYKDREASARQMRDRQDLEKHNKLQELKDQAASAQRFREQQETERRRRLEDMRHRDADRRGQVEERKRIIQQAEQDRREAVIRKNMVGQDDFQGERNRLDAKSRNERSNVVFAFGSSTPRMLDPREAGSFWGTRRATSTTNVHLVDSNSASYRRSSDVVDSDLSRKRATSAHSLDRKTEDLCISSSMYEVFHWEDVNNTPHKHPPSKNEGTRLRLTKSRDSSPGRRRPAQPHSWSRPRTPEPRPSPPSLISSPLQPQSNSSSNSSASDKNPNTKLSVWEFDDNFVALGPTGSPNEAAATPAQNSSSSSKRYSHRHASVFTGAGCTYSHAGEDIMSKSMTAAIPSAARRRTDLIPTLPSMRENFGSNKNSPRHRSPGMRSGTVTPNSPSRPASAMSGASGVSSQVSLRPRTSPRKPRPLSIAGSTLTSADKPKDSSRESRPTERKSSVGSLTHKPTRAKSAGSDRSGPTTPARTPATTPSKRPTPQPKTESSSRKASDSAASRKVSLGSKTTTTPKARTTPRTTPLQSPAVESKPLPGTKEKKASVGKEQKSDAVQSDKVSEENTNANSEASVEAEAKKDVEGIPGAMGNYTESKENNPQKHNQEESEEKTQQNGLSESAIQSTEDLPKTEEITNNKEEIITNKEEIITNKEEIVSKVEEKTEKKAEEKTEKKAEEKTEQKAEEKDKTLAQKAAEKPVTGYASEEDYKIAMAEKRRLVREEKEKQAELERQKVREEEERERREEEEYLRLMNDQRKAEEERLQKAIENAQKEREEEEKRKEEEEKQRIEAEKIEAQKAIENEERLRKEEEERQARKSRVAAIMARTRGKSGGSTPNKNESKTPSEEGKTFEDGGVMNQSMTDSMIGSMTSSMIAEATNNEQNDNSSLPTSDVSSLATSGISSQPPSDVSSHPSSDLSNQPLSDVSSQSELNNKMEDILGGVASIKLSQQPHLNGDSPVMPMDTSTPTQQVDLLGNLSHVNSVNHNGVDNTSSNNTQNVQSNNVVDVPLSSTSDAENFEQIIDISQTKLSNEDAVNSNPTTPFIAFEQNLNKKQSQDNTSTVPDLLM